MELQACEKADQIHPFIKSFGNHNTTIATSVTAELAKYNLWYKKYFKNQDNSKCEYKVSKNKSRIQYLNHSDSVYKAFKEIEQDLLKGLCYNVDNPQKLSIIETALCYGLCLDYDALTSAKNEVKDLKCAFDKYNDNANAERKEFLYQLYKLNAICRFKIIDTAMFSLFETDVLADDKLSVFSVSNISDYLTELFALGECPSDNFISIMDNIINMSRDNNAPVFKIIEQYAFLPHTLENDLLENAYWNDREELEQKLTEIREKYAENSQNVTDATVFRSSDVDDEETYDFEASSASQVDQTNMYG